MDEELIQQIVSFLSKYYGWELIIIGLTIALTMLVKIPIRKAADKYAQKNNIDKSVITWVIGVFPFVFSFILVFLLYFYRAGWNLDAISWKMVVVEASTLGGAAIGVYEFIKKLIKGITAKNKTQTIAVEGNTTVVTTTIKEMNNDGSVDNTTPSYVQNRHKKK